MLTKLFKYDLLFGLKRYSVLFLLLAGTWLSGLAVSLIGNMFLNNFFLIINVILSLFIIGAYIITSLQFFYNALSTDESYFNYTVPVKTTSLVFSKLAVIWMWGAAMAGALVLIWLSLYHALLVPMGINLLDPSFDPENMLDILISMGIAQFILTTCLLAFAVSLFNTPTLKSTNGGMIVVAVAAYLLMQAVGVIQLVVIGLWQYISDPDIMAALWSNTLEPGQELIFMENVQWIYLGLSTLLAPLFFCLTVRMVKKHRSI